MSHVTGHRTRPSHVSHLINLQPDGSGAPKQMPAVVVVVVEVFVVAVVVVAVVVELVHSPHVAGHACAMVLLEPHR